MTRPERVVFWLMMSAVVGLLLTVAFGPLIWPDLATTTTTITVTTPKGNP